MGVWQNLWLIKELVLNLYSSFWDVDCSVEDMSVCDA